MSKSFVSYEISTLLQQGVLKGLQTPISARFSGLPQVKGYSLFFSKNIALTHANISDR